MVSYISTRSTDFSEHKFSEVLIDSMASDGGLYCPVNLPELDLSKVTSFKSALELVILGFTGDWISESEVRELIDKAYQNFEYEDVCKLNNLDDSLALLDLTGGPTLAFKDVAMQMLALMIDRQLSDDGSKAVVVGATSGDTGSAAINALVGMDNISVIILHPYNRVSEIQRRQMTTVISDNVINLAVKGSFDDCQRLVKTAFTDPHLSSQYNLIAVNSINFARVMIQIAYYLSTSIMHGSYVDFFVPTGNFGNILAGWYAKYLGAPIDNLVAAVNKNDSFVRLLNSNSLVSGNVYETLSPSMDIQIPSNLERSLWEVGNRDSLKLKEYIDSYFQNGFVDFPPEWIQNLRNNFGGVSVSDNQTLQTIAEIYHQYGIVIDPHTSVGVSAANRLRSKNLKVVCQTASASKFPDAINTALDFSLELPERVSSILDKEEKYSVINSSYDELLQSFNSI